MARSDVVTRDRPGAAEYAYVDGAGREHLPIYDRAHVRTAIARWDQTAFESDAARERARRRIIAAARRHGIHLAQSDKLSAPTR